MVHLKINPDLPGHIFQHTLLYGRQDRFPLQLPYPVDMVGHDHECIKPNFLPFRQKSHSICHDRFILVRFQQVLPAFDRRCGEVQASVSFGR